MILIFNFAFNLVLKDIFNHVDATSLTILKNNRGKTLKKFAGSSSLICSFLRKVFMLTRKFGNKIESFRNICIFVHYLLGFFQNSIFFIVNPYLYTSNLEFFDKFLLT
jgi:hypothetical protein